VYPLPMGGESWSGTYYVEPDTRPPGAPDPHGEYAAALPDYFRTMGIALVGGREFADSDRDSSQRVIIVDEVAANLHWPSESPIGKCVKTGGNTSPCSYVIGVVRHARTSGPRTEGEPQLYVPILQRPQWSVAYTVALRGDQRSGAEAIRSALKAVDPSLPVTRLLPMHDVIAGATARDRFNLLALGVFAAIATVLAAVGLYGVMAYLVTQRVQEIGVRLALGGQPGQIVRLVVLEGLRMAATGIGVGLIAALALSRTVSGMLFGVDKTDPLTYASVAILLAVVTAIAAYVPARRATRVDPLMTLRGG